MAAHVFALRGVSPDIFDVLSTYGIPVYTWYTAGFFPAAAALYCIGAFWTMILASVCCALSYPVRWHGIALSALSFALRCSVFCVLGFRDHNLFHLSINRTNNQYGHWVRWVSTGTMYFECRNNGSRSRRTHIWAVHADGGEDRVTAVVNCCMRWEKKQANKRSGGFWPDGADFPPAFFSSPTSEGASISAYTGDRS